MQGGREVGREGGRERRREGGVDSVLIETMGYSTVNRLL